MARIVAWGALLGALLLGTGTAEAQVTYLGEFCWDVRSAQAGAAPLRLQLGVLSVGSGHFTVNGRLAGEGGGRVEAIHGNAELAGASVLLTLVSSFGVPLQSAREADTFNAALDLATLSGTYKMVGLVGGGAPPEVVTDDGTLATVPCP